MPNSPNLALESVISRILDTVIARAYDLDGPSHTDIATALMVITTRWAKELIPPAQIRVTVDQTLNEPAPMLMIQEIDIPGRKPLPPWCLGVVEPLDQ